MSPKIKKKEEDSKEFNVVLWPSKSLKKVLPPIGKLTDEDLEFIDVMLEFCAERKALGVAANQLGGKIRVCVCVFPDHDKPLVMINPTIVGGGGKIRTQEGCFSAPGLGPMISRKGWVRVRWVNTEMFPQEERFQGFNAKIVQHEIDHLDGLCIIDKISGAEKIKFKRHLDTLKIMAGHTPAGYGRNDKGRVFKKRGR